VRRARSWKRSPWDADPLSWFTAPNLPLAAAGIALVHGTLVLTVNAQSGSRPIVQVVALFIGVAALVGVHLVTRPPRGALTLWAAVPLALFSSSALVLSAWGYRGDDVALELWWAPLVCSLTLLAMAPYASSQRLAITGSVMVVVVAATVVLMVAPDESVWPPYSAVMIALFPIVVGTVGGVVLVQAITTGLADWSERPLDVVGSDPDDDAAIDEVDATTSARVAAATQLIRAVLARGEVTEADAASAGELAERLREELTSDIDRTWLERVALGAPLRIDDEHRLADQLDLAQRTALRALLDALLTPDAGRIGLARLEVRRTDDGAIAVALRIASSLPEGRRETFLAPYYVGLRSTVNKLRWRSGPVTAVEFEVAGASRARPALQRTPEPGTPGGPVAR
jgi:hypothetical protein